jgi:hypothetical protein
MNFFPAGTISRRKFDDFRNQRAIKAQFMGMFTAQVMVVD